MSITAVVENNTVKLPILVPDGTRVEITLPEMPSHRSVAERYGSFAGIAEDMPADLARNLDHYVHGLPPKL